MKFSHCGRLLASAGQDNVVRIWALKNAFDYFNNMRMKYNTEGIFPLLAGFKKSRDIWHFYILGIIMPSYLAIICSNHYFPYKPQT